MAGDFITFDPPGSTNTVPSGITPSGVITGYYTNKSGVTHGFLRTAAGAFTTFDPPGSKYTHTTAITPAGVIVGVYCDVAVNCAEPGDVFLGVAHGFVRTPDGTFTTFDAPTGFSIYAGIYNRGGQPPGITPVGLIAGTYFDPSSFIEHGFLRTPDGTLMTFDPPGSTYTEVTYINNAGAIVGDYFDQNGNNHGFLRAPDGTVTSFDAPSATQGFTIPFAINPDGVITGANAAAAGFLRYPNGTFITYAAGAIITQGVSINPAGAVTGFFLGSGLHGFLRTPDGIITTLDAPGSTFTEASQISPGGIIIGNYNDASGVGHGFLFFPAH
jgi:hypothetical protein